MHISICSLVAQIYSINVWFRWRLGEVHLQTQHERGRQSWEDMCSSVWGPGLSLWGRLPFLWQLHAHGQAAGRHHLASPAGETAGVREGGKSTEMEFFMLCKSVLSFDALSGVVTFKLTKQTLDFPTDCGVYGVVIVKKHT